MQPFLHPHGGVMQHRVCHRNSVTAILLAVMLCWNGFAHAARPSRRLALLQAALQQQSPGVSAAPAPETKAPPPPAQPAGVRERLRSAHTLLLTETGNDASFPLSGDAVSNTVLDALNRWGRYTVVTDVHNADLVLQLHGVLTATDTPGAPDPTTGLSTSSVSYSASLQITVADPHSLAPLWVFHLPVQPALRHVSRTKNLSLLGEATVSQLKLLAGDPLTHQEQADLKQATSNHLGLILGLAAAGTALTLGLFFITRHSAQQDQANFCQQHNISPCPGS